MHMYVTYLEESKIIHITQQLKQNVTEVAQQSNNEASSFANWEDVNIICSLQ